VEKLSRLATSALLPELTGEEITFSARCTSLGIVWKGTFAAVVHFTVASVKLSDLSIAAPERLNAPPFEFTRAKARKRSRTFWNTRTFMQVKPVFARFACFGTLNSQFSDAECCDSLARVAVAVCTLARTTSKTWRRHNCTIVAINRLCTSTANFLESILAFSACNFINITLL
jgi:hypothetical protein